MDKIAERIKELIDNLGLTNSEFAKRTNLNPATVSHILGGRNKASLQVIGNIKEAFTNVNIDYLIAGSGSMFTDFTNVNSPDPAVNTSSAFPMEGVRIASIGAMPPSHEQVPQPQEDLFTQDPEVSEPEPSPPTAKPPQKEPEKEAPKKEKAIDRIVIFYTDGSFKSYQSEIF